MKSMFVYPVALSLLLAVSPSYGSEWERQMDARAMAQDESVTAGTTRYDWQDVRTNRSRLLERGLMGMDQRVGFRSGDRRRADRIIRDWSEIHENRRRQLERDS